MTTYQGVPRKPFAPVAPVNTIPLTPFKSIIASALEENKIPNAMLSPKTPATAAAVLMHVATTPAPACLFNEAVVKAPVEETEYSFEERRLAFYVGGR